MLEFLNAEFAMIFLMGLNEQFSQIRAQVLLNDPLPTINKFFSLIIQRREVEKYWHFTFDWNYCFDDEHKEQKTKQ